MQKMVRCMCKTLGVAVLMEFTTNKVTNVVDLDHLMTIFNYLEDMAFLIDLDEDGVFRCVEVNPAYIKGMGLTLQQLKNKRVDEILSDGEEAAVIANYRRAISQKQALTYEESIKLNDHVQTFETTIIPIFLQDNHSCCYILGVSRDITARKKYEDAILEAKRELETIIQHQQGIILKVEKRGGDFIHTLCEGQLISQFDLTSEDVIGSRPQDLFNEPLASKLVEHYRYCWDTGKKATFEFCDIDDIREFYWLVAVSPILENGETVSLAVYSIDILDKKKAEDALMKTEKLSLVGKLAAGIGHELRNPLTAIRGFIQFMRENKREIRDEYFDIIESELESLNHIAGELMILGKPQAKHFKRINLIGILNEVAFLLEPEAFRQGIQLKKQYQSDYVYVFGEKYQLKQVIINLIKNAIDALSGKTNGEVRIECKENQKGPFIKIADNGCGISKEMIRKIGEPFFTTKEKGTGLGMLVSCRIIKNHKGYMACESEEGKGTAFTIQFPKCPEKE